MAINNDPFVQNHLTNLAQNILEASAKNNVEIPYAAALVIAEKLGYELDDLGEFVDGKGDRGVDFWYISDSGLYIYQVKTHHLIDGEFLDVETLFDNTGVTDLIRAKTFLFDTETVLPNHKLFKLRQAFRTLLDNHKSQESANPIHVYFSLIILGNSLTDGAFEDLASFENSLASLTSFEGTSLNAHIELITVQNILETEWREQNQEWKDILDNRDSNIVLNPMRHAKDGSNYLNDSKSA